MLKPGVLGAALGAVMLAALPASAAPAAGTAPAAVAAPEGVAAVQPAYYWRGRYYRYYWRGGYFPYYWHGQYYHYRRWRNGVWFYY